VSFLKIKAVLVVLLQATRMALVVAVETAEAFTILEQLC
jgi:hypothetical protein